MFNKIIVTSRIKFNLVKMLEFFAVLFGINTTEPTVNSIYSAKVYFHKPFGNFLSSLFGSSIQVTSNIELKKNPYLWFKNDTSKIIENCPKTIAFLKNHLNRSDYILNTSKKDIEAMKEYKDISSTIENDDISNFENLQEAIAYTLKNHPEAILAEFHSENEIKTIDRKTMEFIIEQNVIKESYKSVLTQEIINRQEMELTFFNESQLQNQIEEQLYYSEMVNSDITTEPKTNRKQRSA